MTSDTTAKTDDVVLREKLAAERTHLANERTLLAYARTSLAFFVAGVSGAHLLENDPWRFVAWAFIALGPAVAASGIWRFLRFRRLVREQERAGRLDSK